MAKQPRNPQKRKKSQSEIGHYLLQWRKKRGLSQERLAERVDCSRGLISQYETGETELSGPMIHALANALNCTPGDLFDVNPLVEGAVIDMMDRFRALDDEGKSKVFGYLDGLSEKKQA